MNRLITCVILTTTLLSGEIVHNINNLTIRSLNGPEAREFIKEIADMRITMFEEYPYLYDGCFAYEKEYLETYFSCPDASVLLVFDGQEIVGFSNSIPLKYESKELTEPFTAFGCDVNDYLYIGEVMIKPAYRNQGLLRSFFTFHENRARNERYRFTSFMTVIRPDDHPLKPVDYRPLDPVWRHFGYELINNLEVHFSWVQIDTKEEMDNALAIWCKEIV